MTKMLKLLFIFTVLLGFGACSSEPKNPDNAEEAYKIAQDFEKKERYQAAIQRYADVKNKFPYSNLATEAELAIADIYFKTQEYIDAQLSYQNFREFHPKHQRIDYVIFRTGMSYYQQLPDTIDRDLTLANDAIYSFNELLNKYPASEYAAEAKEKREKAYVMLAEKELYIADFYLKNKMADSALLRYEQAFKKYGGFGLDARMLYGAIITAQEVQDEARVKTYTNILLSQFSDSPEAAKIKSEERK